jgi:parallel beta helix pectate lyase-like protein
MRSSAHRSASGRRTPRDGRGLRGALAALAVLVSIASAHGAFAMRACGDDVDGHGTAVPCACGDMLVSSRTLRAADRITRKPCAATGLFVAATGRVVIDLAGRTIRGEGQGTGIQVVRGSLSLAGPGSIEGFGTGVLARGPTALVSVLGVRFARNRMNGLYADSDGYAVQGSVAEENGHDGFALGGSGYAVDGNRAARNGRYGFNLSGMGAHLGGGLGNEAIENAKSGFWLIGTMHEVVGATAIGNGDYGFYAMAMHTLLADIHAERGDGHGIRVEGNGLALTGNTAAANRGFGVWVSGDLLDDRGGNSGTDNVGFMGKAELLPATLRDTAPALIQCRIGALPCR